jgi:hypothetical protein
MRFLSLFAPACLWACFLHAQSGESFRVRPATDFTASTTEKPFVWPAQLELRVPFAPTVFPSEAGTYAVYELYLTNFGSTALPLSMIEVLDADVRNAKSIASFDAERLKAMIQPFGNSADQAASGEPVIPGGQCRIIFMFVARDVGAHWPDHLYHRVTSDHSTVEGAEITTHHDLLHILGAPLHGEGWLAADGPSNDIDNHHRRGVIVLNGSSVDSRRYAIDWKIIKDGSSSAGDPRDVRSYYAYDQPVLAVSDGEVLVARDGLPDNIPGHGAAFHPAVPITFDTIAGNHIVLALGGGQFAYYLHLKPGSLAVKVGDRIHKGDAIAHIGGSGDAREPHLHFEVTNSSILLLGEGLPYLLDHFAVMNQDASPATAHRSALPTGGSTIAF